MKKFISMVMTAAMVASLVPATAFAASNHNGDVKATAKVVDAWTKHQADITDRVVSNSKYQAPELQLKVDDATYSQTNGQAEAELKLSLDGAEFYVDGATTEDALKSALEKGIMVKTGDRAPIISGTITNKYKYSTAVTVDDTLKTEILEEYYATGKVPAKYVVVPTAVANQEKENLNDADAAALQKAIDDKVTNPKTTAHDALMNWLDLKSSGEQGHKKLSPAITAPNKYEWSNKISVNGQTVSGIVGRGLAVGEGADYYTEAELIAAYKTVKGSEPADTVADKTTWLATAKTEFDNAVGSGKPVDTSSKAIVTYEKVPYQGTKPVDPSKRMVTATVKSVNKGEAKIVLKGELAKDDVISIDMLSILDNSSRSAYVSVTSSDIKISNETEDFAYVTIADKDIKATTKKLVKISDDENARIYEGGIVVSPSVDHSYVAGDKIELRLNRGFKFDKADIAKLHVNGVPVSATFVDDDEVYFILTKEVMDAAHNEELIIQSKNRDDKLDGLDITVDGVKSGNKGVITVKAYDGAKNFTIIGKADVEVVEVVDYKVIMSVDKDKTVPVYYNTVNANDEGLTSREDHETLAITLEETFPGAWSSRKGFKITVPDGVYVTDVDVRSTSEFTKDGKKAQLTTQDWKEAFEKAYQNGDHKNFEFDKRVFDDVDVTLKDKVASMTFVLTLVADYEFEGDVKIGFEGDAVDKQEVVAAKFEKPYTVESKQNDLKIDARQTKLDSTIVTKEAKEGLWDKNAEFVYNIEKGHIQFEDNAKFEVDKESNMEIKDDYRAHDAKQDAAMLFSVKKVGGNKPAAVTISDMALYMERNIPQGAYALELTGTLRNNYMGQKLFAPDDARVTKNKGDETITGAALKGDNYVDDVSDSSKVVNKDFINVITARRDEDGFTTRIAVPVGETFIFAGVDKLEGAANSMEVPAYINKDNYTMLPLRAVARALGIANGNIYWNQASQTATVQYGNSRIMAFKLGSKEMIINGHAMPAVAGIEMTNNRLFLSLRDLGVAMNVPSEKIAWDSKTKTAYLNPTEEDMAAIKG